MCITQTFRKQGGSTLDTLNANNAVTRKLIYNLNERKENEFSYQEI